MSDSGARDDLGPAPQVCSSVALQLALTKKIFESHGIPETGEISYDAFVAEFYSFMLPKSPIDQDRSAIETIEVRIVTARQRVLDAWKLIPPSGDGGPLSSTFSLDRGGGAVAAAANSGNPL